MASCIRIVWFQKISIPNPMEDHWNFRGVGGVQGKLLFQKVTNHEQNIESNLQSIVNTKTVLLAIEMRLTSLTLMFLFFFVVS